MLARNSSTTICPTFLPIYNYFKRGKGTRNKHAIKQAEKKISGPLLGGVTGRDGDFEKDCRVAARYNMPTQFFVTVSTYRIPTICFLRLEMFSRWKFPTVSRNIKEPNCCYHIITNRSTIKLLFCKGFSLDFLLNLSHRRKKTFEIYFSTKLEI